MTKPKESRVVPEAEYRGCRQAWDLLMAFGSILNSAENLPAKDRRYFVEKVRQFTSDYEIRTEGK